MTPPLPSTGALAGSTISPKSSSKPDMTALWAGGSSRVSGSGAVQRTGSRPPPAEYRARPASLPRGAFHCHQRGGRHSGEERPAPFHDKHD
jgi:hypothetical protein